MNRRQHSRQALHTSLSSKLTEVARSGRWPRIAPYTNDLLAARSAAELKHRYRHGLAHFGFVGFGFWGGRSDNRFLLTGASDLPERYGKFASQRPAAMQAVFGRFEDWQRRLDNDWKDRLIRPALECMDAPPATRPLHAALCASVMDFGSPGYQDVLIVPIDDPAAPAGSQQVRHAHLPMLAQTGSSDLVAGISLTKIFDCLYHQLSTGPAEENTVPRPREPSVHLTDREKTVLRAAAGGLTQKQIAETTGMRLGEVRYCLDSARERYGFATNIQTIVQAVRDHGWEV